MLNLRETLLQLAQFFFPTTNFRSDFLNYSRISFTRSPRFPRLSELSQFSHRQRASHSPAASTDNILRVCENPSPFPTSAPVSKPLTMSLEAETKSVVAQFDFTDEQVNQGVKEFIRQMGTYFFRVCLPFPHINQLSCDHKGRFLTVATCFLEEGLEKDGTSLSQIPTYVTAVPNGTEKVGLIVARCLCHPHDSIN